MWDGTVEAATGALLWSVPAPRIHALAAAGGLAVAFGGNVRAFDLRTGKLAWEALLTDVAGHAAGLPAIAGDEVVWPTDSELHFFSLKTGTRTRAVLPFLERYGAAPGVLIPTADKLVSVSANPSRVLALGSSQRSVERRLAEIAARPDAARPHFELARIAARRRNWPLAEEHFAARKRKSTSNGRSRSTRRMRWPGLG